MNTKRLILVLSALCVCAANGQAASETDCNGKSFRCVDPGSYVGCVPNPDDSTQTNIGESDAVLCADDTICDDGADSPCTPIAAEPVPDAPEHQPDESAADTPQNPEEGNNDEDGNDGADENETPAQTDAPSDGNDGDDGSDVAPPSDSGSGDGAATEAPEEGNAPDDGNSENDSSDVPSGSGDGDASGTEAPEEGNNPDDGNDGSEATTPNGDNGDGEDNGSGSESTEPNGGSETTTPEAEEPTPAPEWTCPAVGRFPHPTDCRKYNFCWDTEHPYVTFTCKPKLVFNVRFGRCSTDWSDCPNLPKCVANHQLLADESNPHYFYICRNIGTPLLPDFVLNRRKCDDHGSFDPNLLVCLPNLDDDDDSSSEEHKEKVKFVCTEAGLFPDLSDETSYYECIVKDIVKGKLKTRHERCPKDHVFSLQDELCIPIVVATPL